jgi:hypothetical protein
MTSAAIVTHSATVRVSRMTLSSRNFSAIPMTVGHNSRSAAQGPVFSHSLVGSCDSEPGVESAEKTHRTAPDEMFNRSRLLFPGLLPIMADIRQ